MNLVSSFKRFPLIQIPQKFEIPENPGNPRIFQGFWIWKIFRVPRSWKFFRIISRNFLRIISSLKEFLALLVNKVINSVNETY